MTKQLPPAYAYMYNSEGGGKGLPLVAFRLDPKKKHHFDEYAVAHQLRERGWVVPAYTMAPNAGTIKLLRVVVREDFSRSRCDSLVKDIQQAVETLLKMKGDTIDQYAAHVKKHHTKSGKNNNDHPEYKKEKHSLQGKHGKVCGYESLIWR